LNAENAIETVKNLNPVTYVYKATPEQVHVGFIAEDVPEMVATKDRKGLSSLDIVAVLTRVVQTQQQAIEEKGKIVEKQQKSLEALEATVAELAAEISYFALVAACSYNTLRIFSDTTVVQYALSFSAMAETRFIMCESGLEFVQG
jgi:hypothetical protein